MVALTKEQVLAKGVLAANRLQHVFAGNALPSRTALESAGEIAGEIAALTRALRGLLDAATTEVFAWGELRGFRNETEAVVNLRVGFGPTLDMIEAVFEMLHDALPSVDPALLQPQALQSMVSQMPTLAKRFRAVLRGFQGLDVVPLRTAVRRYFDAAFDRLALDEELVEATERAWRALEEGNQPTVALDEALAFLEKE